MVLSHAKLYAKTLRCAMNTCKQDDGVCIAAPGLHDACQQIRMDIGEGSLTAMPSGLKASPSTTRHWVFLVGATYGMVWYGWYVQKGLDDEHMTMPTDIPSLRECSP